MYFNSANSTQIQTGVSASTLGIQGTNARTFTFWCYTADWAGGKVFNIGDTSGGNTYAQFRTNATNQWKLSYNGNGLIVTVASSGSVWIHFALTWDGTTSTMYANGVNVGTLVYAMNIPSAACLQLGYGSVSSYGYWNGAIADFRVYNSCLSAIDVGSIANSTGQDGVNTNLQARYFTTQTSIGLPMSLLSTTMMKSSLSTSSAPSASNRMLLVIVANQQGTQSDGVTALSWGGKALTSIGSIEVWQSTTNIAADRLEGWMLFESDIAAASGSSFSISWSTTPSSPIYGVMWFSNVGNQSTGSVIGGGSNNTTIGTTQTLYTSALTPNPGDFCLVATSAGNAGTTPDPNEFSCPSTGWAIAGATNSANAGNSLGIGYFTGSSQPPVSTTPGLTCTASNPYRQAISCAQFLNSNFVMDMSGNGYNVTVTSGPAPTAYSNSFAYIYD